jgi:chemotaxis protein MotB
MARKKSEEEHENHERWLVSYADFITLLFAFFVVMYAISTLNTGKYRVLSDALGSAFGRAPILQSTRGQTEMGGGASPRMISAVRHDNAVRKEKEQLTVIARDIQQALAPLVKQGMVHVTQSSRGINVEINASVLFATGDAKLTSESGQALRAVAVVLKNDKHALQVEGYTDNVPISTPQFASNWELSGVRASSVARLLIESGIDEKRLVIVGHGANDPIGANDTPEGRSRNRRVELMILSDLPEVTKEVPVAASAGGHR